MASSILSSYGGYGGTATRTNLFAKADTNGDDSVSKTELFSLLSGKKTDDKKDEDISDLTEKLFSKLDKDGDGQISQSEMQAAQPPRFDVGTGQALIAQQEAGAQPPSPEDFFTQADSDGDGTLSQKELLAMLGDGGEDKLAELLDKLDSNGDGSISKDEFAKGKPENQGDEEANKLFTSIDTNGDGNLTADELRAALKNGSSADVDSLLSALDENGDGSVSKDEFAAAAKPQGPPPPPPPTEESDGVFSALDTNGDGQISATEWGQATQSLTSANTTSTDLSAGKLDSRMLGFLIGNFNQMAA
jgi:Ca2+-binding EF-hand superfamily protein